MENRTFTYKLTIKEHHLDTFGHVNNATYLQLYEEARWQLITDNGYGLSTVREKQQGPIILEANLRFMRELRLRQEITIHSQTTEYNAKVGTIKQWMTDADGNICSEVVMKFGLFDTKNRKIIPATKEWLEAIT
ncbi:acyl-CoA thioesterase [Roseivirga pacifica]|uniref:acyl-CoA thioesterase n=1 Tax=Roseivirga pacifica TaxID=1267423 RepID=UPI00227BD720|nr:thioesterase family protein [Roseivirga pacifica]